MKRYIVRFEYVNFDNNVEKHNKVQHIKDIRAAFGFGLKEAKQAVEFFVDVIGDPWGRGSIEMSAEHLAHYMHWAFNAPVQYINLYDISEVTTNICNVVGEYNYG